MSIQFIIYLLAIGLQLSICDEDSINYGSKTLDKGEEYERVKVSSNSKNGDPITSINSEGTAHTEESVTVPSQHEEVHREEIVPTKFRFPALFRHFTKDVTIGEQKRAEKCQCHGDPINESTMKIIFPIFLFIFILVAVLLFVFGYKFMVPAERIPEIFAGRKRTKELKQQAKLDKQRKEKEDQEEEPEEVSAPSKTN